jgi:hypothetical protein
MSPLRLRILFVFVSFFSFLPLSFAQYGAGIQGTVTDKSGAIVAGANVTVTNEATGVSRNAVTTGSGFYSITGLAPGNYTVNIDAPSFKKSANPHVAVAAEAVRGFNVVLDTGSNQETVTVTAAPGGLQTENANVGTTISAQQVTNLPQFGRDPYQLVRLTPGVFADSSRQGNGNSLAIPQQVGPGGSNSEIFQTENQVQAIANGQRVTANDFLLDGVSVNSLDWGGAAVVTPNPESIQEISVASDSYSAQDGRNSGAQVKVISKNGTNDLHGSAFAKFNDKGLNAFNKFYGPSAGASNITCEGGTPSEFTTFASHCPTRVDQKYRDFAGSIGGPIIKDKLFFFFSYEGVRLSNTSLLRDQHLETPQFEQYVIQNNPGSLAAKIFSTPGIAPRFAGSTPSSVTDCCSFIPNYGLGRWYIAGNQVGQAIGNGPDGIPDWEIADLVAPNTSSGNQYNARVDYTQGNNQFFASTYIVKLDNFNGGARPIDDITLQPNNYVGTVGWTRTISGTMLNELRANFTRFAFDQRQPVGNTNFGIPDIGLFDFDSGGFGAVDHGFIGITQSGATPQAAAQNTYGLADTFSWIRGRHAWKFGVEARREQNNNDQPGAARPYYQFRGLLNFANDACCFNEQIQVNPATGAPPVSIRYYRTADYALFAQDDWKVKPTLTVNLGLRWEYFTPVTELNNTLSNYIFGSQGIVDGTVQPVHQLYQSDRNNFGPRVGFAWSPAAYNSKVVFRGGFGVLYNRYFGVVFDNVRQDTPFSALASPCCFFDPGPIVGPPPGSNIQYGLGANSQATSYAPNPALAFGVAPNGALCGDPTCATITPVSLFGSLPQEPNPYVYAFSMQTQFQLANNLILELGYQGSRSRKLVRTIDVNRLNPGDTFDGLLDRFQNDGSNGQPCGSGNPTCSAPHATGNADFTNIFVPLPDVNASFDAMVTHVTYRMSHGLQVDGMYTWSHAIDTASYEVGFQQTDPADQNIDRGNSDFDIRNNFVLSSSWQMPFWRGNHTLAGNTLGGWTVSAIMSKHSGFPYSALIGSCNTNADRNGDGTCPDLPFAYNGGVILHPDKQQWINGVFPDPTTEFDITTLGPGCRCRNIFTGPGYTSIDLTVGKDFALPEMKVLGSGGLLAIRANFFNAFNILNLTPLIPASAPTDILNPTSFGRPSDGLAGRVIELQARLSF